MALRDQDHGSGLWGLPVECGCACHRHPGVKHIMACCTAPPYTDDFLGDALMRLDTTPHSAPQEKEAFDRESQGTGL